MAAVLEKQAKRWTYEDYYKLDDDQRYELIGGNLLMAPAPTLWHQDWLMDLAVLLRQHIRKNHLGRLFIAPVDVVLDDDNTVQPDLVFVANANAGILRQRAIFGAPDLLVELVSASSVRRDRYVKKDLYARFGVKEYWIGDPANSSMEIFSLYKGRYKPHCAAEEKGKLTSLVLTGLEFDLSEIAPPSTSDI
ncbi:MAG TPA: Uma2 family endonuclease [Candidatus Cybelea sp.]|nr:Uma2 family endonuclease [Candidatus Cybelea sp.]